MINDKDKQYFLSLKPEDITFELLVSLFADKNASTTNKKMEVKGSRFKTYDEFYLEKGEYINNSRVLTNVGLFIYNKLIVEKELSHVLGYVNDVIDKKVLNKIEDKLSDALLNDKISVMAMVNYLNKTQWIGMQFHTVISGSFTMGTLKPIPSVIATRDKLIKENKDKLANGDVVVAASIEKTLLNEAKEKLDKDSGMDMYKSGARGSFGNNYKNISVMKGPVFNPTTGEFDIVESNFMEGIRKEEIPVYANGIVTGAYPRAIGTATSGYFSKQIIAALQAVQLGKPGSDCGTKGFVLVHLTEKNYNDFRYRYIIEGSKTVLLDESNYKKYIGRDIKLRSPMYCISEKLCNKCAGEMYAKLGINNIGLTAARVSSTLLNMSLKKFHDTSSHISEIKPKEITI